jgi:hypothetical protein
LLIAASQRDSQQHQPAPQHVAINRTHRRQLPEE